MLLFQVSFRIKSCIMMEIIIMAMLIRIRMTMMVMMTKTMKMTITMTMMMTMMMLRSLANLFAWQHFCTSSSSTHTLL